jgi:hypothetical protein
MIPVSQRLGEKGFLVFRNEILQMIDHWGCFLLSIILRPSNGCARGCAESMLPIFKGFLKWSVFQFFISEGIFLQREKGEEGVFLHPTLAF